MNRSSGGPVRTCVGCRAAVGSSELVRFVAVDGMLVCDPTATLPGRGAWLHPDQRCARLARKRGGFRRGLRVGSLDESVLDRLAS